MNFSEEIDISHKLDFLLLFFFLGNPNWCHFKLIFKSIQIICDNISGNTLCHVDIFCCFKLWFEKVKTYVWENKIKLQKFAFLNSFHYGIGVKVLKTAMFEYVKCQILFEWPPEVVVVMMVRNGLLSRKWRKLRRWKIAQND